MDSIKWTRSLQKAMNGKLFSEDCKNDQNIIITYENPEKYQLLNKILEKYIPSTSTSQKVLNNKSLKITKILLLDAPKVLANKLALNIYDLIKEVNHVSDKYHEDNHQYLKFRPFFSLLASNYEICTLERTIIDSFKTGNDKKLTDMITHNSFANFIYYSQRKLNPNVPDTWPHDIINESNADFIREYVRMANFLIYPRGIRQSNGLVKDSDQLFKDHEWLSYKALAYASHIK